MVKMMHDSGRSSPKAADAALERLFGLGVLLTEAMDRELADRGLTRPRAEVIWRLSLDGPVTQRQLSNVLRCTPRNVTGLVDALEAGGFVARTAHPTDRRATLVTLTRRGRAVASAWRRENEKTANLLFGDVRTPELRRFITTLDHVLDRLGPSTTPEYREAG